MSQLTVIDSLGLPAPDANQKSTLEFGISKHAQSFSFHIWFDPTVSPRRGGSFRLVGPTGFQVPNYSQTFLYPQALSGSQAQPEIPLDGTSLSQGYGAVTVPVGTSQAGQIGGDWKAIVDLSNSLMTETDFTVRICQRLNDPDESSDPLSQAPSYVYAVNANLFLVGGENEDSATNADMIAQAVKYMNIGIFNKAGLTIRACELERLDVDAASITSDLYGSGTQKLLADNADAEALNIFFVPSMQINVASAAGFAMLPGPQGFKSPYSAVFCSIKKPGGLSWNAVTLARRVAHEIGHYLGLTHESSCLDASYAAPDCSTALRNPGSLLADGINKNLMYTSNPGNNLNSKQIYIIQKAPLVTATAPAVIKLQTRTPVVSLKVTVKTGSAMYSWWRLDGAGTDDYIYFSIGGDKTAKTQLLDSFDNDFEARLTDTFRLDPSGLCIEDINSFKFTKRWNKLGTLWAWITPGGSGKTPPGVRDGEDAWQISSVEISVNGASVYAKTGIDVWLRDYDMTLDSWGDTIPEDKLRSLIPG
jgi:hypothetical protein